MVWILVVLLAIALIVTFVNRHHLHGVVKQKSRAIDNLYGQVSKESEAKESFHKRVIELEDTIEREYGIKVRQEVVEVKTHFTKLEWVVMLSGVHKLLSSSKNQEDARVYIQILDKIQEFIDHLKESESGDLNGV